MDPPAVFSWIIAMAAGWTVVRLWRWTAWRSSRPKPSDRAVYACTLETRASELETAGDLDGAMQALLASHSTRSSRAAVLAHELLQRHPDAFKAKGCPVRQGIGQTQSPTAATTTKLNLLASPSLQAPMQDTVSTEDLSDADDAKDSININSSIDSDEGEILASRGAGAATGLVQERDDDDDGESPWERGWQGPEGFKPPSSTDDAASSGTGLLSSSPSTRSIDGGNGRDASGLRNFTIAQLNAFDGSVPAPSTRGGVVKAAKPRPIYIALRGNVYNATAGRHLYGPGGKYSEFAGHDISRRVAHGLGRESSRSCGGGELDNLSLEGLGRFEKMTLTGWEDTFAARGYSLLGRVVDPPSPRLFSRAELRNFDGRPVSEEGAAPSAGGSLRRPTPPGYAVPPIYMGVRDRVFDVSFGGSEFYIEGGAYECLAGRDASRVLARMSMTQEDIEGVLHYSSLTDRECKNLSDWVEKLGEGGKGYPVVGWLDIGVS